MNIALVVNMMFDLAMHLPIMNLITLNTAMLIFHLIFKFPTIKTHVVKRFKTHVKHLTAHSMQK